MRRSEKCREVAVIILSSSDAVQDRAEAARLGASLYIRTLLSGYRILIRE
jgi:DNA-binding response OmpR family regulator